MLFVVAAAYAADCPDREMLLRQLEQDVVVGNVEAAHSTLSALENAFGCGSLADARTVARVWLAEAVLRETDGLTVAADQALSAAWHLSPTTWTEALGSDLRARWQQPRPISFGTITLTGLPHDQIAAIDGEVLRFPARLPQGLHLLQVGRPGAVAHARILNLDTTDYRLALDTEALVAAFRPSVSLSDPRSALSLPRALEERPPGTESGRRPSHPVRTALLYEIVAAGMIGTTFLTREAYYAVDPASPSRQLLWVAHNGLIGGAVTAGVAGVVTLSFGAARSPQPPSAR